MGFDRFSEGKRLGIARFSLRFLAGGDGHGLEPLEAERSTGATPTGGAPTRGEGRSDANPVLAGGPDGEAFAQPVERLFRLPRGQAHEVIGRVEFCPVVMDFQTHPVGAGPRDEQPFPTGFAQVVAEVAADVGVDVALGEGGAGDDDGAP